MGRRSLSLLLLLVLTTCGLWGQGINTPANPADWEEINFDFNSSVLVDGFPSLLRLAELLRANDGYRVKIEGYTDALGTAQYNLNLGMARANTVRDFLLKYGARNSQITTSSLGLTSPRVPSQGTTYRPTDEARYMNRRVVLTVTDAQGNTIGAGGGAGDAIRAINAAQGAQGGQPNAAPTECCQNVLKRLDQLDEIAKMLKDMADQNAALRRDLDALRQSQQDAAKAQQAIDARLNQPPPPPPPAPPRPPSADEVAAAVQARMAANRPPTFQLLGLNVGSDSDRNVTFSGRGRFFKPYGDHFGVQAQAEYYYLRGQQEGQFDIGLVDRVNRRLQAGLFSSFKTVSLSGSQHTGTLGQGSFVLDYLFSRGKIGIFASKGFKTTALINRANGRDVFGNIQNNIIEERYLSVIDQVGLGTSIGLMGNVYAEGNIAYLRSVASTNRAGGSLRLVFPINDKFALTAEGSVNDSLLPVRGTQQGRAAIGFQLGNFIRPKNLLDTTHAVPMEIPRMKYETFTKRIRSGNDPPVADAGPNQSNVAAGLVRLDGSNSFDPDGDPITYDWVQESGPAVSLPGASTPYPTFAAAAGQIYAFRLVVRDNQGGSAIARVSVSTKASDRAQILFFTANPLSIAAGQSSTLSWRVLAADTVTISGIPGNVGLQGSLTVSPTTTTTYTLTATSSINTETSQVTVVVTGVQFLSCFASPANINAGGSATLNWTTPNATGVNITPGIGAVAGSGSVSVTPAQSTHYTLTATGQGATGTCSIEVTVQPAPAVVPVIAQFTASPATINQGQTSTLSWNVTGATSVSISSLGTVQPQGTQGVSPAATTTYVLTATNATGSVTAQTSVTVIPPSLPIIAQFAASPATINQGQSSTLQWNVTGATSVSISTLGTVALQGTQSVSPAATTTYVLTATNAAGSVTAQTSVSVIPPSLPIIAQFTANPATINQGQSSALSWNVTGATSVSISTLGTVGSQGTQNVSPAATTTYVLTATNAGGSVTAQATVSVVPVTLPVVVTFTANPATINQGQSSTLTWNVTGATAVSISTLGTVAAQGTQAVSPAATTTYTLTATNAAGSTTAQATVTVNPPPPPPVPVIVQFSASPTTINQGQSSTLTWNVTGATSVSISSLGTVQAQGTQSVSPATTTTYTLTATNAAGSATAQATVTVIPLPPPVVVQFSASPTTINQGQSSTLTWNVTGATSISISTLGTVPANGTQSVSPAATTTYTLTATNAGGSVTAQATVTVNIPPPALPVILQFSASPTTINQGESSTLTWNVTGATTVSISTLGTVASQGTQSVSPSVTTTYILTATNAAGSVTAQATVNVNVIPVPTILLFVVSKPSPDNGYQLLCTTTGAQTINIAGTIFTGVQTASVFVNPQITTTYSCVATSSGGLSTTAFLTVPVEQ